MRPLTLERPKPLIEVAGIPLIERIASSLPEEITELIVVVGYKAEMIEERYPKELAGRPVSYIHQPLPPDGTYGALERAKHLLKGRFMVILGDDLHSRRGLQMALEHPLSVLAYEHEHPERFGVMVINKDGTLADIIEKPNDPPTNLVSTGVMVLDERIFNYEVAPGAKGERYIPTALAQLLKETPVSVVRSPRWVPVGTLEELNFVEELYKQGDDPTA